MTFIAIVVALIVTVIIGTVVVSVRQAQQVNKKNDEIAARLKDIWRDE